MFPLWRQAGSASRRIQLRGAMDCRQCFCSEAIGGLAIEENFCNLTEMDEEMDALDRSIAEIDAVIEDKTASKQLRTAVRRFLFMDPQDAKEDTETLAEIFARRLFACEERDITADVEDANPDGPPRDEEVDDMIFEMGNARCDYATERLIRFAGVLERENVRPRIPQVLLVAIARTLICTCVSRAGVDQGLKDAQSVFEETFNELAPKMRKMPELRN